MTISQRYTTGPLANDQLHSQRLRQLRAELAHDPAALEQFWQQIEQQGSPLIEPLEDAEYCMVTFLWRSKDPSIRAMLVALNTITDFDRYQNDISNHLMYTMGGTDIWFKSYIFASDLRVSYQIYPFDAERNELQPDNCTDKRSWRTLLNTALPDPNNNDSICVRHNGAISSTLSLPAAPPQPWRKQRKTQKRGQIIELFLQSELLGEQRRVWVYVPASTQATSYHTLILFDGEHWVKHLNIGATFDNLIAEQHIPATLVLMPETPNRADELSCNAQFADFLADELLAWAAQHWPISPEPAHTSISGQSLGGLMALFTAYQRPDRIGQVLAQSSSLWWSPDGNETEWLTEQITQTEQRPITIFMLVGQQEWMLIGPNERMRDALLTKGYPLIYRQYNGGHDYAMWWGALADGLIALKQTRS